MAKSRYKIYQNEQPYFVTCTIINWLPLFGNSSIVSIIIDSLKYLQEEDRLTIYAYMIMENHIHLVASSHNLSKELGIFKSFTARKIIDFLKETNLNHILKQLNYYKLKHKHDRDYQFWQEGSHPQLIKYDEMMVQKIEYIHNNPVRRGYVDEPVHWRYSSVRNYADMEGILKIMKFSI